MFSAFSLKAQLIGDNWYAFEFLKDGVKNINLNGKIYSNAGGLKVNGNNFIFFQQNEADSTYYVIHNYNKYGPFKKVGSKFILTASGKFIFIFTKLNSELVFFNVNGKVYGGYKDGFWSTDANDFDSEGMTENGNWYFVYKDLKDKWFLNVNNIKTYPLFKDKDNDYNLSSVLIDNTGRVIYSGYQGNNESNSQSSVIYMDGEIVYGKIDRDGLFKQPNDNRQYYNESNIILTDKHNNSMEKYYKYFNGKLYGPYSSVPETRSNWDNQKGEFMYCFTKNTNLYFNINGIEHGPYLDDEYSEHIYRSFFYSASNYLYVAKNLSGKYIINIKGTISGPYDEIKTTYLDKDGNFCYTYKSGSEWNIRNNFRTENYQEALEYIKEAYSDSKGNMLCMLNIEGADIVVYMPINEDNVVYEYEDYSTSEFSLINGKYMFFIKNNRINVNGNIIYLPYCSAEYISPSSILVSDGSYAWSYSDESYYGTFFMNGQVIKRAKTFDKKYIDSSGKYLLRYIKNDIYYVNINGSEFVQGDSDYIMNFFVGPRWISLK